MNIVEKKLYQRYSVKEDNLYLYPIEKESTIQVNFRGKFYKTFDSQVNILVQMEPVTAEKFDVPLLGYRICDSSSTSNCYLTEEELDMNVKKPKLTMLKDKNGDYQVYGSIKYEPVNCRES